MQHMTGEMTDLTNAWPQTAPSPSCLVTKLLTAIHLKYEKQLEPLVCWSAANSAWNKAASGLKTPAEPQQDSKLITEKQNMRADLDTSQPFVKLSRNTPLPLI